MAKQSQLVREFLRDRYIEVARQRGDTSIRVVAGDVHRAMGLHNRVPLVCNAMRSRALLSECKVGIAAQEGPPSGLGTRVALVYDLAGGGAPPGPGLEAFRALRGVGESIFAALGGGEAFLRSQRG